MTTATEAAYYSILDTYTPLDVKDILTNGASRKLYIIRHKMTYSVGMQSITRVYIIHYLTQVQNALLTT